MMPATGDAYPAVRQGGETDPNPADIGAELLTLAAIESTPVHDVEFTGPAIVLPSSYRVTAAAQAVVAAVSVAFARLAELRSGGGLAAPTIAIDSTECAAAFQSERHLRLERPVQLWDGLAGHYETSDGYIQFHTNFAHHRRALLDALGCPMDADRERVAAQVARLERFELEHRVGAGGGIAAAMRSVEEWNGHPHRAHVAGRPPLTINSSGGHTGHSGAAPPEPAAAERPLVGLRVLDFTRVIAGPVCTRSLAAYGADVLRIGAEGLPVVDSILPDTTLGKRFAGCDITTSAGRDAVLRLVGDADVVVVGFRPGALANHGLGPGELFEANPDLVLASLNAFGEDGPWGGKRGFDSITQTATGIVAEEMEAYGSRTPRSLPCQLLDHGTGFLLCLGILSALAQRHTTGGAYTVDASLLTTRNWLESLGRADPEVGRWLVEDDVSPFMESRPSAFGAVRHVRHPGTITGIAARWDRGPAPPGTDDAEWLPVEN